MIEQFEWSSNPSEPINYVYEYQSNNKIYYGIHNIKIQYGDNTPIEVSAKFDTGAKSSSISYDVAKKLGVPDDLLKCSILIEDEKIDKTIGKEQLNERIQLLSKEYPNLELDSVRSASGVSIRVYLPLTIFHSGRTIKTSANLKDRTGLKAEALIGLNDIL